MKKDEMIDCISECVLMECSIECENCNKCIGGEFIDELDLSKRAYKEGWRIKDEKLLCKVCTKL
jgi:hypothetical protein